MVYYACLISGGFMFAMVLAVTLETAPLDLEAVMVRLTTQAAQDTRARHERRLSGTKKQKSEDIGSGKPVKLNEWRLTMGPNSTLECQMIKDGRPVLGAQAKPSRVDILGSFRTRYHLHMVSPKPVDGYYVVAFSPADPDQRVKEDPNDPDVAEQEIVMNHLSGIAYIDAERFFIRRIHAWLEDPFSRKFVGRVTEATVRMDQELVEGLPVPKHSEFTVRFSKGLGLFLNTVRQITIDYEYDPLPILPAPSSP